MTRHAFTLALLAACTPDAPSAPSFQQDVMPILAANCVRCHGYPVIGGGPALMRLDTYGDIAVDDTTRFSGAGINASSIAERVASDERPMPPRFRLDDYQVATLENWAAGAAPGAAPPRGEPRPGNRPPSITVARGGAGAVITVESRVDDADGDLVAGELRLRVGASDRVVGPVRSGRVELRWDSTGIPPGDYPLTAHLDDGADVHAVELGTLTVGGP
jgi:hypothetical protein